MQFGKGKPSAGVFIDSDFRNMDQALAVSLLYGLQGKNDCRVQVIAISRPDLKTTGYIDMVNRFYHGPSAVFNQLQPIAMPTVGKPGETPEPFVSVFDKKKADGSPAYRNQVKRVIETGDPNTLYRNYLEAQYDQNCLFVLAGPATNLASALEFRGMKDLIAAKAKYLVFADYENNSKLDPAAAKRVFAEWPTPIVAVGADVGAAIPFPGASIDNEFKQVEDNPVADAYRAWKGLPAELPAPALAASLYAARPKEGYFKIADATDGKYQRLTADPAQKEKIQKAYVELASAKPVLPQRFRPPAAADAVKAKEAAAAKDKPADPGDKVIVKQDEN